MRPTRVEPVKLTLRTAGCAIKDSTTLPASTGALLITLTTPGGKPASANTLPSKAWVPGLISDAFRITVFPQAKGAAIARIARIIGAFHGAMPNTTPAGWRTEMERQPLISVVCTVPLICVTSDATSRSMFAASPTLKLTHGREAPTSPIMTSANSSDLDARVSAAASNNWRRSVGFTVSIGVQIWL